MKKQYHEYVLYGSLGIALLTLVITFGGLVLQRNSADQPVPQQWFMPIISGTTEQGDVSIELKPLGVRDGKLVVNIAANTHSVDLSQFDLKQIARLEYEGKSASPFTAPVLSGHHSSGVLEFEVGK